MACELGPSPVDMSWLLGLVAGDGCLSAPHPKSSGVVTVCLGPDEELAKETVRVFGVAMNCVPTIKLQDRKPPRAPVWIVRTCRNFAYYELSQHGPMGTYDWVIPAAVKVSNELLGSWISGLFDAEGTVLGREVRCGTVNAAGMDDIQLSLSRLGIESKRYVGKKARSDWKDQHWVSVLGQTQLHLFREKVGFRCPRKRAALDSLLSSYKRETSTHAEFRAMGDRAAELRRAKLSYDEISTRLGVSAERVRSAIRRHHPDLLGEYGGASAVSRGPKPEFLDRVRELRLAGKSVEAVADELQVSRSVVSTAMSHLPGGARARAPRARDPKILALVDRIRELRSQGVGSAEAARRLGEKPSKVNNLVTRYRIGKDPGKEPPPA